MSTPILRCSTYYMNDLVLSVLNLRREILFFYQMIKTVKNIGFWFIHDLQTVFVGGDHPGICNIKQY